jgi:uncharacterized membrane protein
MTVSSLRPSSPESYDNQPDLPGRTKILDLDYKVAAVLAYVPLFLINVVFSLIWLKTEEQSRFLRFHAIQSLILSGGLLAGGFAIAILTAIIIFIPVIGPPIAGFLHLIWMGVIGFYIVVSIIAMVKAYNGVAFKMPLIGEIATQKAE